MFNVNCGVVFTLPLVDRQALDGGSFQLTDLALDYAAVELIRTTTLANSQSADHEAVTSEDNQTLAEELNKRLNISVQAIQKLIRQVVQIPHKRMSDRRPKDAIVNLYSIVYYQPSSG